MNAFPEQIEATPMLMMCGSSSFQQAFYAGVVMAVPLLAFVYAITSLPGKRLKRRHRAVLLLDLLESALRLRQSPSQTITRMITLRDPMIGRHFAELAFHLQAGLSLREALDKTPRMLPAQVTAMLRVADETGNLARVLPACRRLLNDANSESVASLHCLLPTFIVIAVAGTATLGIVDTLVFPKLREIAEGPIGGSLKAAQPWSGGIVIAFWLAIFQTGVLFLLGMLAFAKPTSKRPLGKFRTWFSAIEHSLHAWVSFKLPWRETRLRRDFSAMLATLLDAGFPEPRAVELAARSTGNNKLVCAAETVVNRMREGSSLIEAMQHFDSKGEFRWRLNIASRNGSGFLAALSGWIEALDARAYQQEQSAVQLLVVALVCLNGVIVGFTAKTLFGGLVSIIEAGVLW